MEIILSYEFYTMLFSNVNLFRKPQYSIIKLQYKPQKYQNKQNPIKKHKTKTAPKISLKRKRKKSENSMEIFRFSPSHAVRSRETIFQFRAIAGGKYGAPSFPPHHYVCFPAPTEYRVSFHIRSLPRTPRTPPPVSRPSEDRKRRKKRRKFDGDGRKNGAHASTSAKALTRIGCWSFFCRGVSKDWHWRVRVLFVFRKI